MLERKSKKKETKPVITTPTAPADPTAPPKCAYIKCPPLKAKGAEFVGMKVREVRKKLHGQLELPSGAPVMLSKDFGQNFTDTSDDYTIEENDTIEFGRTSAEKGS